MAQGKQINKDKFGIESYMAKILDKGVSSSNLYEFEVLASKEMRRFMDANAKKQGGADLFPKFTGDKTGQFCTKDEFIVSRYSDSGSTFNSIDVRMPKKGEGLRRWHLLKCSMSLDVSFICDLGSSNL